jgi:hypothetical protein
LRSERDALLKAVEAFTGTMQAHVEGVAAVAQLKAANQRAEAASQSLASAQEENAAMQATLDATMNQHASERAALKAAHSEQLQRFEIDANKQAAVAEELRHTVSALQAGAHASPSS